MLQGHTRTLKTQNPDAGKIAPQFSQHVADQESGQNGEGSLKMRNLSNTAFKYGDSKASPTKVGMAYEFAAVNASASPSVNNTLSGKVTVSVPPQKRPLAQSWTSKMTPPHRKMPNLSTKT